MSAVATSGVAPLSTAYTVHPTRQSRTCSTCRHMRTDAIGPNREVATCDHPATQASIVTGEPTVECWAMRHSAGVLHEATITCGQQGLLWEPITTAAPHVPTPQGLLHRALPAAPQLHSGGLTP